MERNKEQKNNVKWKNRGKEKEPFSIMILPILLTLGFVPLVTHMYTIESYVDKLFYGGEVSNNYDAFLYGKGIVLLALAGIMLAALIGGWFFDKEWPKLGLAFIPLAVYALFVLISSIRSEYQEFAMKGISDSYQSMFILLAYCVLPVYSYVMIRSEASVRRIFTWWMVGLFLLIFIGITQMFFKDFWSTWLGRHIMLPIKEWDMNLKFKFESGRVYMSQYNPNYVGGLAVMIILPFGLLAMFEKGVKRWLFALTAVGMFLCLLGSQSKNGIIALIFSIVLMLVFFRKKLKKYWIVTLITSAALLGSVIGMDFARDHFIFNALKATWVTLTTNTEDAQDEKSRLEDIQTMDECVIVYYDENELYVQCEYNGDGSSMFFKVCDQDGKEIVYTDADGDGIYNLKDERFENIMLRGGKQNGVPVFALNIGGTWWAFTNDVDDGGYYYFAPDGSLSKMIKAESAVFTNKGKLGSGRGYIWARSFPVLKETILIGKGADNYWAYFPRYDYVEAWKNGYYAKTVTTPHNMYLQIGINSGVIALIAFLTFFVLYFVDCIKLYWKEDFNHFLPRAGIGICLAVSAYMMTGVLNDMMVCVAPVFWCLTGVGMAVNRLYRKSQK